tara:strand:- start:14930 stop:17902 length:2973 start_codon:yes stop_codon:yes gene_type:complete
MNFKKSNISFHDLMPYRIHEILLVSSEYDAFILEQDGKLSEQIMNEYMGMNLSYAPRVSNATSANLAIKMIDEKSFDLVIVMMRLSDMNPIQLGEKIKSKYPNKATVLLAFDESEIKKIPYSQIQYFDEIFIWSGNSNVFPAIIKCIEDKNNLSNDIHMGDIRIIVLVEDTPKYYSSILPALYKQIIFNTKQLIDKSLDDTQKLLHMRGRPKIILTKNYEEATILLNKYKNNILGIITDLRFKLNKIKNNNAGIKLIEFIRTQDKTVPILVQSTHIVQNKILSQYSVKYINKNSTKFFKDLKKFILENLGFGDFKFRLSNNKIISYASNLEELKKELKKIPPKSIIYHASNNHLSNWLAARGEFIIASKFRKIKHGDFKNIEDKRKYYIELIDEKINSDNKTPIIDFSNYNFNKLHNFIRIGKGSLGGKARGIAFANSKITTEKIKKKYSSININIPKTIVISTNEFDDFMETNNLWDFALTSNNNNQIEKKFIKSKLSKNLINILKKILRVSKNPLAIRSSGLLEDSQYKPLAGMYSTYMLPNSNKKLEERLNQLCEAIKRVYASTFFKEPKSLMDSISQKYEEEKMAIIIMELIGVNHNNIYYPTISGVCQSFNYYPVSYMERGDGIAYLALGLGKTIADGEKSLRYCPKYPNILPQYYSPKASIENSQNQFYALNLNNGINPMKKGETNNLQLFNIEQAELDKELNYIASVVSTQDNIIRDSLKYNGYKILTFSSILKYNKNPINELIKDLLKKGEKLIGCPIEIEFAININKNKNDEFFLLQIKPMTIDNYNNKINIEKIKSTNQTLCYSNQVLGDGITQKIKHIIYVDTKKFKREATMKIAAKIGEYNKKLGSKNPYLLLGPGRWGTTDSWLGIPVNWEQITNAKVIIETGIDALNPDPSFGSHFFQNITSLRIGYFTIEKKLQKKNIDWNWIMKQEIIEESEYVKIIKLQNPITVKIDGINGEGIILKNDKIAENMNEIESSGI